MKRTMLVLLAFLLGCTADDGACCKDKGGALAAKEKAGSDQPGGSIWQQLDQARREKRARGPTEAAKNEAAAKALPTGWRQKIDAWWKLYQTNDPGWPRAKAEWLALADPAPSNLAENLLHAYVIAWDKNDRPGFERAKDELLSIPDQSLPLLVLGISSGGGDSVVRNVSTDLLAASGDAAVAPIERAWPGAKPKGKWELARTLRKMQRPAAVPMLSRIATSRDAGFEPRLEAVQALGEMKDPAGYEALVTCVSDPDRSVRRFACQALGAFGNPAAAGVLRSAMQQAQTRGESDVAEEAAKSIRALGGNP